MSSSGRWFAPGRVNLVGDHTDHQLGWVLPFAIATGTTVTVDLNDTSMLRIRSSRFGAAPPRAVGTLATPPARARHTWSVYVEGTVAVLRDRGVDIDGVTVDIDGDLAVGAGLASSASLVCATASALLDAAGEVVEPGAVAALAQQVENDYVGAPVGFMDPAAVMYGQADHALLIDTRARAVEPIALPTTTSDLVLLLVDTGRRHATSGPAYAERVAQCHEAAALLGVDSLRDVDDVSALDGITDHQLRRRSRHVVSENRRVLHLAALLRSGRPRDIGDLLVKSHESLRDDFEVSTVELDAVVESATRNGALGARMTGAGFGGSALVVVDAKVAHDVRAALVADLERRFDARPKVFEVAPAAGAHRSAPTNPSSG